MEWFDMAAGIDDEPAGLLLIDETAIAPGLAIELHIRTTHGGAIAVWLLADGTLLWFPAVGTSTT